MQYAFAARICEFIYAHTENSECIRAYLRAKVSTYLQRNVCDFLLVYVCMCWHMRAFIATRIIKSDIWACNGLSNIFHIWSVYYNNATNVVTVQQSKARRKSYKVHNSLLICTAEIAKILENTVRQTYICTYITVNSLKLLKLPKHRNMSGKSWKNKWLELDCTYDVHLYVCR